MALSLRSTTKHQTTKAKPGKLMLGVLAAGMMAFVSFAGVANATSAPNMSNGYGGQNVVVTNNINLNVHGSNNAITIVIRYVFGG